MSHDATDKFLIGFIPTFFWNFPAVLILLSRYFHDVEITGNNLNLRKDQCFDCHIHQVYVEASGVEPVDLFSGSQMYCILDRYENTITLYCPLPDTSPGKTLNKFVCNFIIILCQWFCLLCDNIPELCVPSNQTDFCVVFLINCVQLHSYFTMLELANRLWSFFQLL